ncbi:MAG: cell division protein DivIVA [Pseudonocardiales bacterium]|nr:cell division protein DivIVA [Pseudonocardiales bacterium]
MVTLLLYGLLAIGLIGGLFLLAVRVLPAGEQIAPPVRDEPVWMLAADRRLAATDVTEVRLPVALRGYRFAETDQLLDRLAEEIRLRDEELDRLRAGDNEFWRGRAPTSAPEPVVPDPAAADEYAEPVPDDHDS